MATRQRQLSAEDQRELQRGVVTPNAFDAYVAVLKARYFDHPVYCVYNSREVEEWGRPGGSVLCKQIPDCTVALLPEYAPAAVPRGAKDIEGNGAWRLWLAGNFRTGYVLVYDPHEPDPEAPAPHIPANIVRLVRECMQTEVVRQPPGRAALGRSVRATVPITEMDQRWSSGLCVLEAMEAMLTVGELDTPDVWRRMPVSRLEDLHYAAALLDPVFRDESGVSMGRRLLRSLASQVPLNEVPSAFRTLAPVRRRQPLPPPRQPRRGGPSPPAAPPPPAAPKAAAPAPKRPAAAAAATPPVAEEDEIQEIGGGFEILNEEEAPPARTTSTHDEPPAADRKRARPAPARARPVADRKRARPAPAPASTGTGADAGDGANDPRSTLPPYALDGVRFGAMVPIPGQRPENAVFRAAIRELYRTHKVLLLGTHLFVSPSRRRFRLDARSIVNLKASLTSEEGGAVELGLFVDRELRADHLLTPYDGAIITSADFEELRKSRKHRFALRMQIGTQDYYINGYSNFAPDYHDWKTYGVYHGDDEYVTMYKQYRSKKPRTSSPADNKPAPKVAGQRKMPEAKNIPEDTKLWIGGASFAQPESTPRTATGETSKNNAKWEFIQVTVKEQPTATEVSVTLPVLRITRFVNRLGEILAPYHNNDLSTLQVRPPPLA